MTSKRCLKVTTGLSTNTCVVASSHVHLYLPTSNYIKKKQQRDRAPDMWKSNFKKNNVIAKEASYINQVLQVKNKGLITKIVPIKCYVVHL